MQNNTGTGVPAMMTVWFATMSKWIAGLDLSYADSVFIQPLQHLVSIVAALIAIIVGLPVATKHVIKFYSFIKNLFKK